MLNNGPLLVWLAPVLVAGALLVNLQETSAEMERPGTQEAIEQERYNLVRRYNAAPDPAILDRLKELKVQEDLLRERGQYVEPPTPVERLASKSYVQVGVPVAIAIALVIAVVWPVQSRRKRAEARP